MTAVERYENPSTLSEIGALSQLAQQIAKTEFVPDALRNRPEAVLACLMYGREIGLGPMQSLSTIHIIKGKPSLSPEAMRALVTQAGHHLRIKLENNAASITGWRKDESEEAAVTVRWTIDDAKAAQIYGEMWKKYPRAMLLARATSELCRAIFPDVIAGLSYTPEEIESFAPEPEPPVGKALPRHPTERALPTAPLPADPATGEVRARRGPPTKAKPVEEPFPEDAAPAAPLATDEQRADVKAALELVPMEHRGELGDRWREAGIASVKAPERFTADDAERALSLLADFMAEKVDTSPFVDAAS